MVEARLHRKIFQNGAYAFVWKCPCGKLNPFNSQLWIAKETVETRLSDEELESLPVVMFDAANRCVKCGERTCELHHWSPVAIFGSEEADRWPKDYLCKPCHDEWHLKITPQLVKSYE